MTARYVDHTIFSHLDMSGCFQLRRGKLVQELASLRIEHVQLAVLPVAQQQPPFALEEHAGGRQLLLRCRTARLRRRGTLGGERAKTLAVRHEKIPTRVERHARGAAEDGLAGSAADLETLAVTNLDAAVRHIQHGYVVTAGAECQRGGGLELRGETVQELAISIQA